METMELETRVYAGLSGDTALTALLANGADSIFHLQAPSDKITRYPALVYKPISDIPALSGDDVELTHRVTFRIHILTRDGRYGVIYRHVHRIMQGIGFARVQAMPYVENGEKILIIDYRIGVSAEWQP